MKTVEERLKEKIRISDSGCWEWEASLKSNGYGGFQYQGKYIRAHRASYLIFKGNIDSTLEVMHSCDNRKCVNPEHLCLGTHAQNMKDMQQKGRVQSVKGSQKQNSKLNEEKVIQIRKLLKEGISLRCLALKFGVDKALILRIKQYKVWKHVEDNT